jgi:hypothetical protein
MPISAQSIIRIAHETLHDVDGVRWPAFELVRYLNIGQREIVRLRPDQKCTTAPVPLVPGHRQQLPAVAMALMDIPNNATGRKRRITKVDVLQLDAVSPDWRSRPGATEIAHFMHDLREPRTFDVFPPAASGAQVDMSYSLYPVDVPVPVDGFAASSVSGNIDLPDHWESALLDYVLFRAYSKDVEFGGNAQMASSYLGMFNAAVGSQLQSTALVAPKN